MSAGSTTITWSYSRPLTIVAGTTVTRASESTSSGVAVSMPAAVRCLRRRSTAASAAITATEPSCSSAAVTSTSIAASSSDGPATGTIDRSPSRRRDTASGTSTPSAGSRRLARATTAAGTRKPTVSGTTAASGLPRWREGVPPVRGGPRRGALGQVAEQGDRAVLAAPGDRAGLHRGEVLRLVDHHVTEAGLALEQSGGLVEQHQVGGAEPGRLHRARRLRPAHRLLLVGGQDAVRRRRVGQQVDHERLGRDRRPGGVEERGDRRDLAHPAQPGLARRVARCGTPTAAAAARPPGPGPVRGRPRTAAPRAVPRRRSGAAARRRSASGTNRPTP